jgi:EF hand domain-containing protein
MVVAACGAFLLSPAAFAARPASDFRAMDANHDGRLSREEHASGAKRMFTLMDADKDGTVTAAEMSAAQERVTGKKAQPGDMPAADKIKVIDTDHDGALSAAEHAAGSRTMFDAMDADKDGALTEAEMAAGHAKMMPARPPAK